MVWTGFVWLSKQTSDKLLYTWKLAFWVHELWEVFKYLWIY